MTAKVVESFRQKEAGNSVIRLFHTQPFLDDKWINGIDRDELKKYMVVKYGKLYDRYLPICKARGEFIPFWDTITYNELNILAPTPIDINLRSIQKSEKVDEARKQFKKASFTYFHTDSWMEAQQKYIDWCADEGIIVNIMEFGKDTGDDL